MKKSQTFAPNPLFESLFFTAAIMLSAGLGFGLALRSASTGASTTVPGAATDPQSGGLLQSGQNFPPRAGWNLDSERKGDNPDGARYNSLQMQ